MSRYCPNCGMPVPVKAKYCRTCGFKLRSISADKKDTPDENSGVMKEPEKEEADVFTVRPDSERAEEVPSEKDIQIEEYQNDTEEDPDTGEDLDADEETEDFVIDLTWLESKTAKGIIAFLLAAAIVIVPFIVSRKLAGTPSSGKPSVSVADPAPEKTETSPEAANDQEEPEDHESTQQPLIEDSTAEEEGITIEEQPQTVSFEEIREEFQRQNWEEYAHLVFAYLKDYDPDAFVRFAEMSGEFTDACLMESSFRPDGYDGEPEFSQTLELKDDQGNSIHLEYEKGYEPEDSWIYIRVTDRWNITELEMSSSGYGTYRELTMTEGRPVSVRTYYIRESEKELERIDIYDYLSYASDGLYEDVEYPVSQNAEVPVVYSVFDVNERLLYCSEEFTLGRYIMFQNGGLGEVYYYYDELGNMIREKTYETYTGKKSVKFNEYAYDEWGHCTEQYNYDENWVLSDSQRMEYNEHGDLTGSYRTVSGYQEGFFADVECSYSYDSYGRISSKHFSEHYSLDLTGEVIYSYY